MGSQVCAVLRSILQLDVVYTQHLKIFVHSFTYLFS